MLVWFGFTLSGVASAGLSGGSVVFNGPPVPIPTLGVLATVLFAGLLMVIALRLLQKNRHTIASFALVAVTMSGALMLASVGVLRAVSAPQIDVSADDLDQPLSFSCNFQNDFTVTEFTNASTQTISVASVNEGSCSVGSVTGEVNCVASSTELAPGESCKIAAVQQSDG